MELYEYKENNKSLVELKPGAFDLEKDIQSIVEANMETLFNIEFVTSEFALGQFRLDTLCFDVENNAFVIVEYKKGSSYSVIDQGYSYLSLMLNNKADFILEYNENKSNSLKKDDIDWSASRIIFISPGFNSFQRNSVNFKDIPFELWVIKRFEGSLISLEALHPTSGESIRQVQNHNTEISKVNNELIIYTEEEHIDKMSDEVLAIFTEIRERLSTYGEAEFVPKKYYVRFSKGNKGVCYIKPRGSRIDINIVAGATKKDGTKSKNYFNMDDPKGISSQRTKNYKSGDVSMEYIIPVKSLHDLDYVEMLIKQKYNTI